MAKSAPVAQSVPSNGEDGFACSGCSRVFRTRAGLGTHRRYCSSKDSIKDNDHALDPLLKLNGITSKEAKTYKRKIAHWLLLRKNRELRNGTRSFRLFKCFLGSQDMNLKHRLKQAASTIIGCIQNDHALCESYSFVCQGGYDPYLYLLPHGRPISPMPPVVKAFILDSIK